jgi:hypothetical protein
MPNTLIRLDTNSWSRFCVDFTTRLDSSGYKSILLTHKEFLAYPDSKFAFRFTLTADIVEDSKRLELVRELVEKEPNTIVFVDGLTVHHLIPDYPLAEYLCLIKRIKCDVFVDEESNSVPTTKGYCINYDKHIRHYESMYATLLPRSPIRSEHNVEDPDFGVMGLDEWCKAYIRNKKISEII